FHSWPIVATHPPIVGCVVRVAPSNNVRYPHGYRTGNCTENLPPGTQQVELPKVQVCRLRPVRRLDKLLYGCPWPSAGRYKAVGAAVFPQPKSPSSVSRAIGLSGPVYG